MLKTVIIEDEKEALILLKSLLKEHCQKNINIIGDAQNVTKGIEIIKEKKPDLIFLDVKLGATETAFDLLNALEASDKLNFRVIFFSNYEKYAIQAFKRSAIHFLLKPVNEYDLKEAVERVTKLPKFSKATKVILYENFEQTTKAGIIILSLVNGGWQKFLLKDIIKFEKEMGGDHTNIFFYESIDTQSPRRIKNLALNVPKISDLMNDCLPNYFIQVYSSVIVSDNYIKKLNTKKKYSFTMINGETINIARTRYDSVEYWYKFPQDRK